MELEIQLTIRIPVDAQSPLTEQDSEDALEIARMLLGAVKCAGAEHSSITEVNYVQETDK